MKILIILTYYRPHISGLTIYAERLARGLVQHGHRVTVLTSHFGHALPYREERDGVTVIRHPVLFKVSKGAIMPGFLTHALSLIREHDVINIHLPQAEGGALALLGRVIARKPVVLTYQCDLQLPPGIFNRVVNELVLRSNKAAGIFANRIVAISDDYACNSSFLTRFKDKIAIIQPPVEMAAPDPKAVLTFRHRHSVNGNPIVGFAARFAEEKGVGYLIQSIPYVADEFPSIKFLLVGENLKVIGENVWERLQPLIQKHSKYIEVLGTLPDEEMHNFLAACDVLTLPSINSTESFGLVQIEAMLSGTPVIASNLPGVREPVRVTGMGEIVPIKDERALAAAIVKVIENRESYLRPRAEIEERFAVERTVEKYEALFEELLKRR
jgi:glycosyltransferase involved in cell wall biosynthesis